MADATIDVPATEATAETTNSPAPATSSPTDSVPPGPQGTDDFSEVSDVVADFVDAQGLNGAGLIVVEKNDGVVHEEYWGEFDADRVSLIASSSKMIVAGVLMRLDGQGLLDIDAPVADIADWGSGNPEITPAQLISNSSGLVGLGPERSGRSPAPQPRSPRASPGIS